MTRHTKPVPPILILDLISGEDEMDTQEEMSLEHLPESVLHDVIRISGWLVENGRNQGWQHCLMCLCSSVLSVLSHWSSPEAEGRSRVLELQSLGAMISQRWKALMTFSFL